MAANKLFGYSVEEAEGRLVITIDGVYAQKVTEHMRSEMEAGRGWYALSHLSPISQINRMARRATWVEHQAAAAATEATDAEPDELQELDLDKIFQQGFSDDYDGFASQFEAYSRALTQLRGEFEANKPKTAAAATINKTPEKP